MLLTDIRFLVTQNNDRDIREDVDVRIEDGRIAEIGDNLRRDDAVVDCSDKVVLPGLINAHTHVPMNVMRGISDNKVLQDWLEEDIFPAEDYLNPEIIYDGTLHAIVEMLQTGTTCFNDMYAPESGIADAVDETGIRAVLARGVLDVDGDRKEKLQESKDFITAWRDHERITPVVAPHAIYTCSEELLHQAKEQADRYDTLLHTHLSETRQENQDCEQEHGMSPTAYLDDLGLLDDRFIGAHGVWLSDRDMELLAASDAGIAHNPCSNLKLGSGVADVPDLQEHGVTVGLATDSVASNNNLNLLEEAKFASLLQKQEDPRQLPEQQALDMMTVDAARLLNMHDAIGSIEPGKQADIVTVDLHDISMTPRYGKRGLLSNLVYSFNGPASDVFVGGDHLVQDGNVSGIDIDTLIDRCQDHADRIRTT